MDQASYDLGDIVRWRSCPTDAYYDYGMVIAKPQIVSAGIYTFTDQIHYLFFRRTEGHNPLQNSRGCTSVY